MREILKKITHPILKKGYNWYYRKPRQYKHRGIELTILPGVFHPGIFLSTNLLIDFFKDQSLSGKKILELGAGSGFISFYLAKKNNAIVTATDVNQQALEGLQSNVVTTKIPINIIKSDLFEAISPNNFDQIIINPPYYPHEPKNEVEQAFYCGTNFEYFKKLFSQLKEEWSTPKTQIIMILSEDCQLDIIKQIAEENGLLLQLTHTIKKRGEKNFIFTIEKEIL